MDRPTEAQLRDELAHYCRIAYQRQLVSGTGGNLSARIPGRDEILITPSAVSLRECTPEDFILVDLAGEKVAGREDLVASKEVFLHTAVYAARPDVHAISHLHPPYCIVFAVRNRQIPLVTITAEVRLGPTPVVPEAPSGSRRLANLVRDTVLAWKDARLILLERHGVLAIGENLRDTIDVADLGEDTARVAHLLSLATGVEARRMWDISVKDEPSMHFYPGDPVLEMRRVRTLAAGDPVNLTHLALGAHTGTHVDAPAHFLEDAPTLEQIPLDRFVGPATVLDLRGRRVIDAEVLRSQDLSARGIVLFKTDNSELWAKPRFDEGFTYLTPDGAELLVERGVTTVGIDYLSIEQFGSTSFAAHKILLGRGVPIIEGLDLRAVSAGAYTLVCLPLNLQGVDGAPARAILMQ